MIDENGENQIKGILYQAFQEGVLKANGVNPYSWFPQLEDIYFEKMVKVLENIKITYPIVYGKDKLE